MSSERLWPLINERVANRLFEELEDLEEALAERCLTLSEQPGLVGGLLEAKVLVEEYRNHYNQERPHSALLGYRTHAEFAASCELASAGDEVLRKELESVSALS